MYFKLAFNIIFIHLCAFQKRVDSFFPSTLSTKNVSRRMCYVIVNEQFLRKTLERRVVHAAFNAGVAFIYRITYVVLSAADWQLK